MNTSHHSSGQQKVILLGAGGHAKVLLDTLQLSGITMDGVSDPGFGKTEKLWRGIAVLGDDNDVLQMNPAEVVLVNGVGSLPGQGLRQQVFRKFKESGFGFLNVIHPFSAIGTGVETGEGFQVMAGAVIQADSRIGSNVIVNTGALIDHDCQIGCHTHIAPGAVLSGGVTVGHGCHIGTGASVVQGVSIGLGSVIGAGTVVVKNVPEGSVLMGQPPQPARKFFTE